MGTYTNIYGYMCLNHQAHIIEPYTCVLTTFPCLYIPHLAVLNTAHNMLPKHVIHTHGPQWKMADAPKLLTDTITHCLELADKERLKTIAFPSVGSGR